MLIFGKIPLPAHGHNGRFITAKSFPVAFGSCPVSWGHWADDDYTFERLGLWSVQKDAFVFMHTLTSYEVGLIGDYVKAGELGISYGLGINAEETRHRVAFYSERVSPRETYEAKHLSSEKVDHISYTPEPFFQNTVKSY